MTARLKAGEGSRAKAKALREEAARIETGAPPKPADAPAPPPPRIVALGMPPADPLAANAWAHDAVIWALHDVMNDTQISSQNRRKEIRTLAASAAKLIPHARLWEAEQLVRAHRARLEEKESKKRGAKLEPRPPRPTAASGART